MAHSVYVACRTLSTAHSLIKGLNHTQAVALDVSSSVDLDKQVAAHDLVISLIPYIHHPAVIKSAIKVRVNVVTTSYVSPAIRELDGAAKEAGIVILNEVGVDPGIDHLNAIKIIDEVHQRGGKVRASILLVLDAIYYVCSHLAYLSIISFLFINSSAVALS